MAKRRTTATPGMEQQTYSVLDVAKFLGVSKSCAYDLFHAKDFPAIRVGRRQLVRKAALMDWMNGQEQCRAQ